jgi:hypothetical protein
VFAGVLLRCMVLSLSEVYRLTGEDLRREYGERGLDNSGSVRFLRRRLTEFIRSGPMAAAAKPEGAHAAGWDDEVRSLDSNEVSLGAVSSHGGGGG